MDTVLLATDGSEYATRAAERAIELAAERGAALHVLAVVDRRTVDEPALSTDELATIEVEDHARERLEVVVEEAAEAGVTTAWERRHGIPHAEILTYAAEIDAAVIVVGEHGTRGDHCGGVGRRVARIADREVVVAGRDAATVN